jgi:hypothetical protein
MLEISTRFRKKEKENPKISPDTKIWQESFPHIRK